MSELEIPRLLAIDDNRENLELITATLASERLQVLTASDPEVGFETFLRVRPRIVLLDLVMPKVSGMELLVRE
jgi:DNA-binding response OmpR family regulator